MKRHTSLAALVLLLAPHAAAQGSDGFVGTSRSVMTSTLCTRVATCTATGSATVLGGTRSFYHLTLRRPGQAGFALNAYDLYVDVHAGVATSATLLYPASNGDLSDGLFRRAFFTAATGVPLGGAAPAIETSCVVKLRGKGANYVIRDIAIPLDGARQQMTMVLAVGTSSWAFRDVPDTQRITTTTTCP